MEPLYVKIKQNNTLIKKIPSGNGRDFFYSFSARRDSQGLIRWYFPVSLLAVKIKDMKRVIGILLQAFMIIISTSLYSQSSSGMQEFGITAGEFTNFPCNQNYLKQDMTVFLRCSLYTDRQTWIFGRHRLSVKHQWFVCDWSHCYSQLRPQLQVINSTCLMFTAGKTFSFITPSSI